MNYILELKKMLSVTGAENPLKNIDRQSLSDHKLPLSYIEFIANFGAGNIDDFLWILSPFTDNPNLNIFKRTEEILPILSDEFEYVSELLSVIKTNPSFLVATTDNGDYIFHCQNENETQIIVLESRLGKAEKYEMSFTQFLYQLLSQTINSAILEAELFEEKIFQAMN
mgnify:CR=1 FL=1